MRALIGLAALLAATPVIAGQAAVTLNGNLVDVASDATPVSDLLDRLGRETGMKVVYEGPRPRVPVTLNVRNSTTAQAVFQVLEGLGIGYATRLDDTGTKVETLLIVASGPGGGPSRPSMPPARPAMPRTFMEEKMPPPEDVTDEAEDDAEPDEEAAEEDDGPGPEARPPQAEPEEDSEPVMPVSAFPDSPFVPAPVLALPAPPAQPTERPGKPEPPSKE
jgi:hypothetical protein